MPLQSSDRVRKRGIVLTDRGLRKLNLARINADNEQGFKRYTLEYLSEQTGLTSTTLSKIFAGSAGVDKRSLKLCFQVFNLTLLAEDYFYPSGDRGDRLDFESESPDKTFADPELLLNPLPISRTLNMDRSPDALPPLRFAVPGGQIPLDSVLYIDRPVLESLCYEAIDGAGASLNIRAPKQMGKSSLMTRILVRARSANYRAVSVSLQLAEAETLQNLERFLKWFCTRVGKQLGPPEAIENVWNPFSGSKANATDYFEEFLLSRIDRPLIVAIDELDQLFAYPDIAREFLLLLRNWSERAKAAVVDSDPWYKLRLVTVH
ncbi:AAA-like domain-containing protein [Pannus brasiliensis CCIBt3594]|uniref:AAA-like domain-containing protein n=1 Tax=Pannus brasiliensis CCIBt3594 TaxID=1427578 RepID=A0AAW9R1S0_9CHRO